MIGFQRLCRAQTWLGSTNLFRTRSSGTFRSSIGPKVGANWAVVSSPNSMNLSNDSPKEIKEKIFTIPNVLSASRIALTPLISYLIVSKGDFQTSVALFAYAGITDLASLDISRCQSAIFNLLGPFRLMDTLPERFLAKPRGLEAFWIRWLTRFSSSPSSSVSAQSMSSLRPWPVW